MKRNTPRHPKTRALAKILNVPRYVAVGLLELLWHATAALTPRGDIGTLDNDHIAEELYWDGDPEVLICGLITTGWLDRCAKHRLVVHDWADHADQGVKRKKPVEDRGFAIIHPIASEKLDDNSSKTSLPSSGCLPPDAGSQKPDATRPCAPRTPPASRASRAAPGGNSKPRRAGFPEPFPEADRIRLGEWAGARGFSMAQVDHAVQTVSDWAVSNGKTKVSWLRTIQGAMREGWALRSYESKKPAPKRLSDLEFGTPEWERAHGYKLDG